MIAVFALAQLASGHRSLALYFSGARAVLARIAYNPDGCFCRGAVRDKFERHLGRTFVSARCWTAH
jgi:hypothetical protein